MSAGLPGLGLGGLFFILSALVAPLTELVRTLRGESTVERWIAVGRQFALAVAMILAVDLTLRVAYLALSLGGIGDPPDAGALTVLPLVPIAITAALLGAALVLAKSLEVSARLRSGRLPPMPIPVTLPSGPRLLGAGATLVAAWFALLFVGASELSPLADGGGDAGGPTPALAGSPGTDPDAQPGSSGADRGEPATSEERVSGDPGRSSGGAASDHDPGSSAGASREPGASPDAGGSAGGSAPAGAHRGDSPPGGSDAEQTTPPPEPRPPADAGPPAAAGPPADAGNPSSGGPPADAGAPSDAGPPDRAGSGTTGPPVHAGPESTGPPEHSQAGGRTA